MMIRLPVPFYPITLTIVRHDMCITPFSPTIERLTGPAGSEVHLSALGASLYITRGWLPRV